MLNELRQKALILDQLEIIREGNRTHFINSLSIGYPKKFRDFVVTCAVETTSCAISLRKY